MSYNLSLTILIVCLLLLFNYILSEKYSQDSVNNTIYSLINKGEYSNLENYLDELKLKNISFIEFLSNNINNKIKLIKNIGEQLSLLSKTNFRLVTPAFQWRETEYSIDLDIYFSHRSSAPGCGELDHYDTRLINNNMTFHFEGNCTMGDDELFFNLTLNLFKKIKNINKINPSRKLIHISMMKEEHQYWNRLLKEGEDNPKNMN